MKSVAIFAVLIGLVFAGRHTVGAAECNLAERFPCQVRIIERVHVRLDGSARELGFDAKRIAKSVRGRLRERVPSTVKVQIEPSTSPAGAGLPPERRSQFYCTLWTVGKYFTVSMFIECGLEGVTGDWAVDARLLGHIRKADLRESVEVALVNVIDKVIERLRYAGDMTELQASRLARQPSN